ncbi:MAG: glycosyltransferase family 9 protein [Alphaproteobacteria bacterium]|nr:glycosyltransferase family 9 protein [Alphaproteobacteria bacterium]
MAQRAGAVLVHLAAGIGNLVLATPLLLVLQRAGFVIDLLLDCDYPAAAALFRDWGAVRRVLDGARDAWSAEAYRHVIPAVPPFYWPRYAARYARVAHAVARPPEALFYQDEQGFYLRFAATLGCDIAHPPAPFLPVPPDAAPGVTPSTVVLAPGCKTGEMAAKRWPGFVELAAALRDVAVVGTADDLHDFAGAPMHFAPHARMLVDRLGLREAAAAMAAARAVVANDSGLGHIAAAVGAPTLLLFGPTPYATLGRPAPNVTILDAGLPCAPCWFGARFAACAGRIDCLRQLSVAQVLAALPPAWSG